MQNDKHIIQTDSQSPNGAEGITALRVIISGGGTGGHIFPAIAIANALKKQQPAAEILFVGANGRMEMEKVPAAGYKIIGLDIQGLQRKAILKNFAFPVKVIRSVSKALSIIKNFKPNVVVGVGGYASGPLLYAASLKGIPYLIQEQNSYAGITNKLLGKKAKKICVAFDGMERFFPAKNILKTGNPIREASIAIEGKKEEGYKYFGLSANKKTILVTGGSLGARTLNNAVKAGIDALLVADVQILWQTGKFYYRGIIEQLGEKYHANICITEFLERMDLAYAIADVIISRAGAGTIAELCAIKKPVILVPSPNVAEDHQTKNALALVNNEAAILVSDVEAPEKLISTAIALLTDNHKQAILINNIGKMAMLNADVLIANEVIKLISA